MKLMLRALSLANILIVFLVSEVAFASNVTVTAANPNSAAPGTVNLNVTVSGSGYKRGAAAKFFVTGTTDPGGVTVNTTTFSSSSQVVATINVDANATIASYDVEVQNTDGSSGKGTELFAVKQNGTLGEVNVISTVYDSDATGNLLLTRSNDGTSTGQATYNAANGVLSDVSGADWELNLNGQTTSTVYLTFSSAVAGSPAAPLPNGYYNARLLSRCYDASNNIVGMFAIAVGSTNNRCSLRVADIDYAGQKYFLVMAPIYPGTGYANVTCTAGNSTGCTAWHVEPNLDSADFAGNVPTVAQLYVVSTHTNRDTLIGSYYNTYRMDFHE